MTTEHLITLANGKQFPAAEGVSLLDAARQAGLVLEHSCRTGRCGSCRTRVLAGSCRPTLPDQFLGPAEQADGWVLSCAVEATSAMRLDIEDLGALADIQIKTLPARIASLERPAPDVLSLTLRLPPNTRFDYLAGQYINIIGPGGLRRSYSLANAPAAGEPLLQLHVREVEGGALSRYWFGAAKPGDLLRFEGPRGSFFLRDVADLDLVLLATGTGIAPIKALLEDLQHRPAAARPRSVHLLWGGRREADLYWRPAFEGLPGLRYTPVLSRADAGWAGELGHVQDALLRLHPDLSRAAVYACGSSAMIETARGRLVAAGLPAKAFFSDAFVSA